MSFGHDKAPETPAAFAGRGLQAIRPGLPMRRTPASQLEFLPTAKPQVLTDWSLLLIPAEEAVRRRVQVRRFRVGD